MAVAKLGESVAVLPTFKRIYEWLVWSADIEKSFDWNQPIRIIPDLGSVMPINQ